jgi:hypothetical protein
MKTIEFEDALKDYLEEMKRTGRYTKAYKAFVEANILKLAMERRPIADSNATMIGSTPSAYKAGGRGRTDPGDNRTPAAGAGE